MIRTITIIGLIIAVWLPLVDYAVFRPRRKALGEASRIRGFEGLVYIGFLLAVALMALSSFGMILIGQSMHRWMLILHMSVAPIFATCLTVLALMWAEQSQFRPADSAGGTTAGSPGQRFHCGEKFAFWVTVLAGFLTISTAMLLMMSWFGSSAQWKLLNLHRLSALLLLIAAVSHGARILLGRSASSKSAG